MDGLSTVASIIAILQFTGEVIGYLNDVKDAPKECQQCTIEACNNQSLLINLRYRLEQGQADDPWFTAVRTLNVDNGPLDQYKQALEELRSRVNIQDGIDKIKKRLLWKLSKNEVASILARMNRLNSLVNIALEMDHFKLSQAIKEDTSIVRDAIPMLQTNVIAIRGLQGLQLDTQKLQQHHMVMQWLSPTDFPAQQHDIISRREEGTGKWFLESPEFKGWREGAERTLLCPGIPGAGKTMMAAIVIDHLNRIKKADVGLAYLFCNYKSQVDQSICGLQSALLKQLTQNRLDIAEPVMQLFDRYSKETFRPSLNDIIEALVSICLDYNDVYVVVDALDECADQDGTRSQLIRNLHELQKRANVRLLFTTRFISEVTQQFQTNPMLEVRADERDVKRFVAGQISRLPTCIRRDDDLARVIQSEIVKAADGMFLLARLHVDSLLDKRTKQKVLLTLEKLSKGSAALDKAYGGAIERIDGQLTEDKLLARRAISWISYAQRPLTTQEVCNALAIERGDRALNSDNIHDLEDIVSVCAGLITIDKVSNVIRLVHYTTQEYFESILWEWNPGAQEEIASACLTYLSFDVFRSSCRTFKDFQKRLSVNIFLHYAAHHWAKHVKPVQGKVSKLALNFLQDTALVSNSAQVVRQFFVNDRPSSYQYPPCLTTGLHLTAESGLVFLTKALLMNNEEGKLSSASSFDSDGKIPLAAVVKETGEVDVNSKDDDGNTALTWAAIAGHAAVAKLLIEADKADINSKGDDSRTALTWAAIRGNEAVVNLLIETGKVDVNAKDNYGQTALTWAVRNGHKAVIKSLIETGKADINLKDSSGRTAMTFAVRHGREAVVKSLIETGKVDVNAKDDDGQTALMWAATYGYKAVVESLIETSKVDVSLEKIQTTMSLLSAQFLAIRNGHEAVVKLLVGETSKIGLSNSCFSQAGLLVAVSLAALDGHDAVVKALVETALLHRNSKSEHERIKWLSALLLAMSRKDEDLIPLLIETSMHDMNLEDEDSHMILSHALRFTISNENESMTKLLLETGKINMNAEESDGQTTLLSALCPAIEAGHETTVKLMIETDQVMANIKDDRHQTGLSWAMSNAAASGHDAVIKLLIDSGTVDINFEVTRGRTTLSSALSSAIDCGQEAVVKMLSAIAKADVDEADVNNADFDKGWEDIMEGANYIFDSHDRTEECDKAVIDIAEAV